MELLRDNNYSNVAITQDVRISERGVGRHADSPSTSIMGVLWELAVAGVNHSIAGNGGDECIDYVPRWQKTVESLIFVSMALWMVYCSLPFLDCSFSHRPKNASRYAVLTAYSLIFGAELAFKMISRTGIFLLNPCHVTTVMQLVMLSMDANDRRACFLFRMHLYWMPGAFFALAFPILNTRFLPGEVFIYYAQHVAIILVPVYLMYLRGGFEPEKANDFVWTTFGLCCFLLYHFAVLQPVAALTHVNLNNILCPAISDPFQTRAYRIIAVGHQFLLIPIISKTFSAIATFALDVVNAVWPPKDE